MTANSVKQYWLVQVPTGMSSLHAGSSVGRAEVGGKSVVVVVVSVTGTVAVGGFVSLLVVAKVVVVVAEVVVPAKN